MGLIFTKVHLHGVQVKEGSVERGLVHKGSFAQGSVKRGFSCTEAELHESLVERGFSNTRFLLQLN